MLQNGARKHPQLFPRKNHFVHPFRNISSHVKLTVPLVCGPVPLKIYACAPDLYHYISKNFRLRRLYPYFVPYTPKNFRLRRLYPCTSKNVRLRRFIIFNSTFRVNNWLSNRVLEYKTPRYQIDTLPTVL